MFRHLSVESLVLSGICVLDLLSTIFLVSYRDFMEGNPLMSYYLDHGVGMFILAKILLFVPPLFIAEWARRQRPEFVKHTLRACICIYVIAYGITFVEVNGINGNALQPIGNEKPISASMFAAH